MTQKRSARIRLIYGAVQSASITAAAVCLMHACVSIYRMGAHPFSREAVAEAFGPIAIPVYLCLALIAGGFLLDLILPADSTKLKAKRNTALILRRLQAKADLDACGEELRTAILSQRKRRATHKRIRAIVLVVCAVVFLCYGANPANFHTSEINSSMAKAMLVLLPCLIPCFGYSLYVEYAAVSSMEREIELLKQAAPAAAKAEPETADSGRNLRTLRTVILVLAVVFLIFGYFTGGTTDVLTKAINICTECVGLG